MDQAILDLGHSQYMRAIGADDVERDDDGFIVLRPSADHVDQTVETLTTSIDSLEERLQALRTSRAAMESYQKTDAYREDKKKSGKKKGKKKKERATLLNMVFNNADQVAAAEEEEAAEQEEKSADSSKRKGGKKKPADTTLETTYGKRFSTVVSMLYDSIQDFDQIAAEIREELDSTQGRTKGMYRSSQMSNLIAATSKKFDATKELGSIAKVISDLEYKEKKDKKTEEGSDTSKAISNLAAKYLRGSYDPDEKKGGKKKKETGKERKKGNFSRSAKAMGYDPDDDDDDISSDSKRKVKDQELAKEFAKALEGRSDAFTFTPYEKHLDIEGTYSFVIVCDPLDPEHTWEFMAVDEKGNAIENFHKEYKDLMPKKKATRMRFDIGKRKATDANSSKTYKLLFTK